MGMEGGKWGGQTFHLEVLVTFTPAKPEFLRIITDKHDPMARVDWPTTVEGRKKKEKKCLVSTKVF